MTNVSKNALFWNFVLFLIDSDEPYVYLSVSQLNNLYSVDVDGCAAGVQNSAGVPMLKQWRFVTSSPRLAASLSAVRCVHGRRRRAACSSAPRQVGQCRRRRDLARTNHEDRLPA